LRDLVNGGGAGRLISAKELVDAGIANIDSRGVLSATATETVAFGQPPAPTGVAASPAIRNVIVTWDIPDYPTHAYAEVWGADTDDIGTAVLLGQTPGAVYTDALGPGKTRYYWVRFVNTQYTEGPYNALHGTSATTPQDLAYTMDILAATYGDTSEAPFFQLNSPQVIGGVTIPAGTYMKAGFIYDGVITNAKIGAAAVDTAKIADASITTAKITDANITTAKIANAAITNALIADATILAAKIADATITGAKIANATISAAKITDATITGAKIADATITSAKIESLAANKIVATNLSAISADLGSITAGTATFSLDANNYLKIDGPNQRIEVWAGGVRRVVLGKL
jgi:uncharacterized protein YjbI with pentapeptide repeats